MSDLDEYEAKKLYNAAISKKEEILSLLDKWRSEYRISMNKKNI